jgi:hypothetical protein
MAPVGRQISVMVLSVTAIRYIAGNISAIRNRLPDLLVESTVGPARSESVWGQHLGHSAPPFGFDFFVGARTLAAARRP